MKHIAIEQLSEAVLKASNCVYEKISGQSIADPYQRQKIWKHIVKCSTDYFQSDSFLSLEQQQLHLLDALNKTIGTPSQRNSSVFPMQALINHMETQEFGNFKKQLFLRSTQGHMLNQQDGYKERLTYIFQYCAQYYYQNGSFEKLPSQTLSLNGGNLRLSEQSDAVNFDLFKDHSEAFVRSYLFLYGKNKSNTAVDIQKEDSEEFALLNSVFETATNTRTTLDQVLSDPLLVEQQPAVSINVEKSPTPARVEPELEPSSRKKKASP